MSNHPTRIEANIPARSAHGKTYPSRTDVFESDADGRWSLLIDGQRIALFEDEVLDICRRATNWSAIRSAHFSMDGFHS